MVLKQWHPCQIVQKPLNQCYGTFSIHTLEKPLNKNNFKNHTCCLSCLGLPYSFIMQKLSNNLNKQQCFGHKGYDCYRKKEVSSVYRCHLLPELRLRRVRLFWTYSCIVVAGHASLQILALSNWEQILSWKYFFWDKQIKNNKDQKEEKQRLMPKFQFFRLNQGLTECTARLWIHLQPV